jgi:hypothetical protein
MRETVSELRQLILIYCLERTPDGSYIALNRRYRPVGFTGLDRVDYETFPGRFKFKRALSAAQIKTLSCKGDPNPERIYIYEEGCVPTASAAHWKAYSARLERLAGYKVVH